MMIKIHYQICPFKENVNFCKNDVEKKNYLHFLNIFLIFLFIYTFLNITIKKIERNSDLFRPMKLLVNNAELAERLK